MSIPATIAPLGRKIGTERKSDFGFFPFLLTSHPQVNGSDSSQHSKRLTDVGEDSLGVLEWCEVATLFVSLEKDRVKPGRIGTFHEGFHAFPRRSTFMGLVQCPFRGQPIVKIVEGSPIL